VTSRTTLPTEGLLSKTGDWGDGNYTFSALAQRWQTLQTDPQAILVPPYNRLPQLTLSGYRRDLLKTDLDILTSYVGFQHESLPSGKRLLAYPSLSLPLQTSWYYFTPKFGMHTTRYFIDQNTLGFEDRTRTLPIVTADTGLTFERDARFVGQSFIQTLEPRLYYVYIPFRDQTRIPNFESGLQDISFASIFSENQFSGHDRINDANQVTGAVTTRFLDARSGAERLRATVGQRYYLKEQEVTLGPSDVRTSNRSDLLAGVTGYVARNWWLDTGLQYNVDDGNFEKFNVGARYRPQPGKAFNAGYRFTRDQIEQVDLAAQWPLSRNWSGLMRWNYSLLDNFLVEALGGLEYNAGCWAARFVVHSFVTSSQERSQAFFAQIELSGLSRVGISPLQLLSQSIVGYQRIPPRGAAASPYYPGMEEE